VRQVTRLGYWPTDVRHIVLTHLDPDHTGGISDFPWCDRAPTYREHDAAMRRPTGGERRRYRPNQWAHAPPGRPTTKPPATTGSASISESEMSKAVIAVTQEAKAFFYASTTNVNAAVAQAGIPLHLFISIVNCRDRALKTTTAPTRGSLPASTPS
jgi:ribonuclease BN (tRNA processing enzyme)